MSTTKNATSNDKCEKKIPNETSSAATVNPVFSVHEFMTMNYDAAYRGERALNGESCTICLEQFSQGTSVKMLPCSHVFHPNCIDQWGETNCTCPTCNAQVILPMATPCKKGTSAPIHHISSNIYGNDAFGNCRRCGKEFYRDASVRPSTAQYFRCPTCKPITSLDIVNSCSVL